MSKKFSAPSSRPRGRPGAKPKSLILGLTLAEAVADRKVTLHYRRVKRSDHFKRYTDGDVLPVRAYVGGPVLCHALVQHVRRSEPASENATGMPAPLGIPTTSEARAAGYQDISEFMHAWISDHDYAWLTRQQQDDPLDPDTYNAQIAARFRDRHAPRPAWALTLKVIKTDSPGRFLLAEPPVYDPRRDPSSPLFDRTLEGKDTLEDHGYTENPARALHDAGEVLTEGEYRAHVARDARDREELRLAMVKFEREHAPREPRIQAARAAAKVKGLDMRDEFRRLDRLVEKQRSHEVSVQLALIESRVFPKVAA